MPRRSKALDTEDLVIAVYAALDDALAEAGIVSRKGKLVPRPGPEPEVDDRENNTHPAGHRMARN